MTLKTCLTILAVFGVLGIHQVAATANADEEVDISGDEDDFQFDNRTNLHMVKSKCIMYI